MSGVWGTTYLVDTNTLAQLRQHRRASKFFRERARIPTDVLREAGKFPDIDTLRELEYMITPSVLKKLIDVMATVDTDDTKLVDLYANRGSADPLVIACALDGIEQEAQYLDPSEWVVVTSDRAVWGKATEVGLVVLTNAEFAEIIDEAEQA